MGLLFNLSFVALFCATLGRIPIREHPIAFPHHPIDVQKDLPLNVKLLSVGDRYAMFNVTGGDTVNGQPISTLFVNYTVDGPTVNLNTEVVSSGKSDGMFSKVVQVTGFNPGLKYEMQFAGENDKGEKGPPSAKVAVLLLPPTPDITVLHPSLQKLKILWGEKRSKSEDYYLLTVEKKSALGCGLTVNLTSCFGNSYTMDDLEVGQVYKLTMVAHNPSGFSEPVVVSYPIE